MNKILRAISIAMLMCLAAVLTLIGTKVEFTNAEKIMYIIFMSLFFICATILFAIFIVDREDKK